MDIEDFLQEMHARFELTRTFIAAIPSESLDFRPLPEMMSARELALHVIGTYRFLRSGMAENDWSLESYKVEGPFGRTQDIVDTLDETYRGFRGKLAAFPSDAFDLRVKPFGVEQKISAIARVVAEHEVHHRGQLYVYLRLMGATLPDTGHGFHGFVADSVPRDTGTR